MYRFVALIWNRDDRNTFEVAERAAATFRADASPWRCVTNNPGFLVFEIVPDRGGLRSYVLPDGLGVLFGRLFTHDGTTLPVGEIKRDTATALVSSGGRYLTQQLWGSYIAFLRNTATQQVHVVRDCSGKLPCFRSHLAGVTLFFSDIGDIAGLTGLHLSVNWKYLAAFIKFNDLQIRESGLREVSELLAGECIVWSRNTAEERRFLWDPSEICRSALVEDESAAVSALRTTTRECVDAWTHVHRRILHRLSGGFDSAVVLANTRLATNPPFVVGLNRYNEQAGEDERPYARAAAERAGVELLERRWDAGVRSLDANALQVPLMAKPAVATLFEFLDVPFINSLTRTYDIDAVWTGQGGDHLFVQTMTNLGAADYAHNHGWNLKLASAIRDSARFTRQSYWHVLRTAVLARRVRNWRPEFLTDRKAPFLSPDAFPDADPASYIIHPWHETSWGLPTGKRLQILFYAELLNRHAPVPQVEFAEQHHPLMSQPLLELCLRIPTYLHLAGGRHRALARKAFADQIPPEIVRRESKGGTTAYFTGVFRDSIPFVRELLLDGILTQERLLDRKVLQSFLGQARPTRSEEFFPMLACIAAELWARKWSAVTARSIAA